MGLARHRRAIILVGLAIGLLVLASAFYINGTRNHPGQAAQTSLQPQAVRVPDPEQDQRIVQIGVTWPESVYCSGQFHATASETADTVSVGSVLSRLQSDGTCANLGTTHNIAWSDLSLKEPLGNRLVIRASDGVVLPALTLSGFLVEAGPVSADITHYSGLNDSPPLAPRKSAHVTAKTDLEQLVGQLNGLPPYPSQVIFCPIDDGSSYIVDFRYTAGGDIVIRINATGCQAVFLGPSPQPVARAFAQSNGPTVFVLFDRLLGE